MKSIITKYINYLNTFKKYNYLLSLLVRRDIKKKYKDSHLGILWSLIAPLLEMIVLSIVFSSLFKRNIENFPVYLLSGRLIFGFFSSSTIASMRSLFAGSNLFSKVYLPKYLIPLSNIISSFVFFLITLIDLVIIMIFTNASVNISIIYAPLYLVTLFIFTCGISLILTTVTVFFRDIQHFYKVFTTLLMYASAIIYPPEIVPAKYQFILTFNPLFHFIKGFRDAVYYGGPLELNNLVLCFIASLISLAIGILVFNKYQDRFIFYV